MKDLPYLKGMTPDDATGQAASMGFKVALSPDPVDSDAPAGTVASTTPRQEDGAPEGCDGHPLLSNGSKAPPTVPPPPITPPPPGTPPTIKPPPGFPTCPPWDPRYPKCGRGGR